MDEQAAITKQEPPRKAAPHPATEATGGAMRVYQTFPEWWAFYNQPPLTANVEEHARAGYQAGVAAAQAEGAEILAMIAHTARKGLDDMEFRVALRRILALSAPAPEAAACMPKRLHTTPCVGPCNCPCSGCSEVRARNEVATPPVRLHKDGCAYVLARTRCNCKHQAATPTREEE